jgi:hypothetical protein
MRVQNGRGDWRPGFRIEGLRRYAFIGDSFTYGAGVAPDQTLSANAERQMNELLPEWPVEAVNLGVGGYNLWNSWLAFKHGPQVYDGVVLVLCCNDADLFGRTYRMKYSEPDHARWESTHPFGPAVALCFDDIASFSQESSLPIAVCFYNVYDLRHRLGIAQIINDLCSARCLPFIDTLVHFRERKFPHADLLVSSADYHPSPMAHEAAGRYLTAMLRRQGWFAKAEASAIGAAPDRILAAAQAMVGSDHYPPDAALNWALCALEAKSQLARRMEAAGGDDDFSAAAARVAEVLNTANRRWHAIQRTNALLGDIATGGLGLASGLYRGQEQSLRLDELGFALGTGDWNRLAVPLQEAAPANQCAADTWPTEITSFLDGCSADLRSLRALTDEIRTLASPAPLGLPHDEVLMLAHLETLARLTDRAQALGRELRSAFLRLKSILEDVRPALSEAHMARVSSLIAAGLKEVKEIFGFAPRLLAACRHLRHPVCARFTTVELTLRGEIIEGRPLCSVGAMIEYSVPNRLPFNDHGAFWADGSPTLIKLQFPAFYAGRLFVRSFAKTADQATVASAMVKVEIYNRKDQPRILEPDSFHKDRTGRFISPLVYLL